MAANVWACLQAYMHDAAKGIDRDYSFNEAKIIETLEGYGNKNAYHGHQSGKPGDEIAPETKTNLTAALKYLRDHKPAKDADDEKPPKPEKREDPTQSEKKKEEKQAAKEEKKADQADLSRQLATALHNAANKAAFERNPKAGVIAGLVVELAAVAKIKGTDNKVLLDLIAKKFSNVKREL